MTYVVHDLRTQSEQVLKVLIESSPKAVRLFEQEAQVLASLHHPGIPQVEPDSSFRVQVGNSTQMHGGSARSLPCLVMEKINGQTLEALLEQHPQGCPEAWVVDWFQQAIDILQVLHQRQIIHRDLKPANLMLRQGTGQLVMIDFGGAKQMHLLSSAGSSTRLFSPGYSPPEQIIGGNIQPATDFYALGRTLIHLLTGCYPAELEDPITGELRWRDRIQVSPDFADLLDELMRTDVQQRPPTAEAIQSRLAPIAASLTAASGASGLLQTAQQQVTIALQQGLKAARQILFTLITAFFKAVFWAFKALLDTFWSILLAVVGASLGTTAGFAIAYRTAIGTRLADLLSQQLGQLLPNVQLAIGADFLIFALAGLGTAWGLTAAGGFGQQRRFWLAGLFGTLGYLLGWAGLLVTQGQGPVVGLALFAAIAPTLLTFGLGLKHQPIIYGLVTIVGIVPCLAVLTALNARFVVDLWQVAVVAAIAPPFWSGLRCFGLFAGLLGGCLGFSHYLFIPFLRLMGWR